MTVSNMYSSQTADVRELFGDYIEGNGDCIALCLYAGDLRTEARTAIEKSLEAFGYGKGACTYACIAAGNESPLDPNALFMLVEGLDPLLIVCADNKSCVALGAAYRENVPAHTVSRIFGRETAAFNDLGKLMESPESKQRAWAVFKQLPKR